jgi:hypothetical protein
MRWLKHNTLFMGMEYWWKETEKRKAESIQAKA